MTQLVWFEHDLRIQDNAALFAASQNAEALVCVYFLEPRRLNQQNFGFSSLGEHRDAFLRQSLRDLHQRLAAKGQRLLVIPGQAELLMPALIENFGITRVYRAWHPGTNEQTTWSKLKSTMPEVKWHQTPGNTLFPTQVIEAKTDEWTNGSFNHFRHKITLDSLEPGAEQPTPLFLPPQPSQNPNYENHPIESGAQGLFEGGESAGAAHLHSYFFDGLVKSYSFDAPRDDLMGYDDSTKFSPWLSAGCLSVRRIYKALKLHEATHGRSAATEAVFQELLWREFYYWRATSRGASLFTCSDNNAGTPVEESYNKRLTDWCEGKTQWPLINASMRELNATGFISNRARQILASCLINELKIDWRYGAAYFEQQLIDYDMACNWGNWRYIAGECVDTRGARHFDIEKQTELFDSRGHYRERWGATENISLSSKADAGERPSI